MGDGVFGMDVRSFRYRLMRFVGIMAIVLGIFLLRLIFWWRAKT